MSDSKLKDPKVPAVIVGTNAYISVADADIYFDNNLQFAAWDALDPDTKARAIITAAQSISLFVDDPCKLPLTPPVDPNLANANAELALYYQQNPDSISSGSTGSNTKRAKAGSAEVEFFRERSSTITRFPSNIMDLLAAACGGGTGAGVAKSGAAFATGTDAESTFEDPNPFGRTEGFK